MWHAEQRNRVKAREYLTNVATLCGSTNYLEYIQRKAAIDGVGTD
ncbi:hypothetical protein [Undibacter mobilis]|nr:hypothetical protein [Undibacter mobilis]